MPLEKSSSKKAFRHNIEAEMASGKPHKQAVAIAYSEKREAIKNHKAPAVKPMKRSGRGR